MKPPRFLSIPLLAAFSVPAGAQLKIQGPAELTKQFSATDGFVYGTTATFGAPYYGERVLGKLVYPESRGNNHCTSGDYDVPQDQPEEGKQELAKIFLVDRGGCTFVTKVALAQARGAHAVVIVDKPSSDLSAEAIQKIVMADDGYGHKVWIPSMMVCRADGRKLIEAARRESVIAELAWDIPRGQLVSADFWMSSGSRESAEFLTRFRESAETLKSSLQFVPHFHIFSLPAEIGESALCITTIDSCGIPRCKPAETKFCAPDPDGPGPVTGSDVANEDLRRLCIWSVTETGDSGSDIRYSPIFWEYSVQFFKDCPLKSARGGKRFGYQCSLDVMKKVGAPVEQVEECISQNYDRLLQEQVDNIAWSPQALRLNGWRYSGPLDPETVLKAICGSFTTKPKECRQLLAPYATGYVVWAAGDFSKMLALAVLLATLTGLFFLLFYRRQVKASVRSALREEVMLEVQSQMDNYVSMEDTSSGQGTGFVARPGISL